MLNWTLNTAVFVDVSLMILYIFFSCFFDGVKGVIANLLFTTVPLLIIIFMNVIMYILTWKRIRDRTKALALNKRAGSSETSHQRAASTMSMFVLAFFIQWWSLALFGVWAFVANDVPQVIHHFVTTFTNLGGVLNLIVFLIMIHRRKSGSDGKGSGGNKDVGSSEMKEKTSDSGLQTFTGSISQELSE